ncbi:hypothetical protein [Nocardioides campestrisoli]|uniref:hypothetical protein n=1 Tax=Nocardioides campestrisoli TaxID=2736757 RepID=UPI00163D8805|nr:hypothetical protein [Nocardioides campestrisoli]
MAAEQGSEGRSFGRRLEKWVRDSAELRELWGSVRGTPSSPEEASLRRYRRSTTREVALPHPSISQRRYDALSQRHRELVVRLVLGLMSVPLLLVLGAVVDPVAARVAIWALVVPVIALGVHHGRALARVATERHLTLKGGLADAWGDWVTARDQLDALEGAAQARAALAANEARMQALVLALGRAESHPDHRDTEEHRESREWVFRSAAKALSLATAEKELEAAIRSEVAAGDLGLAPDGDLDALDQALDTARELTGRTPELRRGLLDDG